MDLVIALTSAVAAMIALAVCYYSLRTIRLFKKSVAARAWVYISIAGVMFGLGAVTFLFQNMFDAASLPIAGTLYTLGGIFLLIGLRKNFLFWSSQDHFT